MLPMGVCIHNRCLRSTALPPSQVVDVDYSVLPFSYGIEIDGRYRETEATRLAPLPQGQQAPA